MSWRLELHKMNLSDRQFIQFKIRIGMRKAGLKSKLGYRDVAGYIVKKYDHLGPKVDQMFPLLDPDLFWSEASEKHLTWYKTSKAPVVPLESYGSISQLNADDASLLNFCDQLPLAMPFIPT